MNLSVTNSVQILGMSAPLGFGHQVMGITLARRNFAFTQWTDPVWLGERWPFLLEQSSNASHGCKLVVVTWLACRYCCFAVAQILNKIEVRGQKQYD